MLSKKRSSKAPSESVTTKRVVVKKVPSTKAKTPVKQKRKEVVILDSKVPKKQILRSKVSTTIKRPVRLRKEGLATRDTAAETVTILEGTVAKRLQDKRQAYEKWFRTQSLQDFAQVSSVFGYLFIITGLLLSAYILGPNWLRIPNQSAALPCLDPALCTQGTSTISGPTVTYVTTPEVIPNEDLVVTTQIEGLDNPVLIITSDDVLPLRLEPSSVDSAVYTFRVPTTTFIPGDYRLRVEGETDGSVRTSFVGPKILIGSLSPAVTDTIDELQGTEVATSTELITQVDWEVEPYQVSLRDVMGTDLLIEFASMYTFEQVAIYARPDHSVQEFFVGQAENQDETWVYSLSNKRLPQGIYTIFAKGIDQNEVKGEAMISFRNIASDPVFKESDETILADTRKDEDRNDSSALLKALSIENHAGTTSELDQTDSEVSASEEVSIATSSELNTLLPNNIANVIEIFAAAKQTNNALLLRASETALTEAILHEVNQVSDTLGPVEVAALENELRSKVKKELAVRVVKAQNSSEFYPADVDGDGISDTEESLISATDPTHPDTDRDGFLDGIETIFGHDPVSYEPEAVLRLEQSGEVPIIETLLGIESVTAYAYYATEGQTPRIYQEISGFGIPNSYAVLRINNDEVISLVTVAADGKFNHTLEFELDNGQHAVSVQYIANSGVAIATSRIFNFIKDDTATNYIKPATAAPVIVATYVEETNSTLPAAVGVVAFGLLLLYMGRGLRVMQLTRQGIVVSST